MRHALESVIRRRFFVVHLALLAVAAVLCARTVTVIASHVVGKKLAATGDTIKVPHSPATKAAATRDFTASSDANIFEGKREQILDAPALIDVTPQPGDECDGAPRSSLRFRLVGAVVFTTPEWSVASIVDESKGDAGAGMFSINDCLEQSKDLSDANAKLAPAPPPCSRVGDGTLLRRIEPERVCIWNETDHRMEYLAIDEPPDKGGAVAAVSPPKPPEKPADDTADIRKVGEGRYDVGQGEVDKALNNLAELSTQARIVPAFEGGKTVGFKLFSIRPGSLYSKIGLQNGDVITRINGYEMSSPEKGLEVYTKLKDSKQVTVDLKRRGKPQTLDYNITQ